MPTLVVHGGISDVLSEDGLRHFREICRHAEVANIARAGHMIAGDRNDVFADAVLEFLGRVVPNRP